MNQRNNLEMGEIEMDRAEIKEQVDELMRQYSEEEIDGDTYFQKMMELTSSVQKSDQEY